MNTRVLLMLAGGAMAVWAFRRWRLAVQFAMVLLILEGAIRKWVFPGSQDLVYFAKDVVFLGTYLGFLRDRSRLRLWVPHLPTLYIALALGVIVGLLQIFNPSLPNLLVGVFGFKAYFFYVPLLFVLPAAFPNSAALYRFLRLYVLASIPIGLLAVAQFFSPPTSILNAYARTNQDDIYIATFGSSSYVRVTGTFSFISGYTAYLLVIAILVLALLGAVGWRFRGQLSLFAVLGMTLLGILMTGSRGPVLFLVLCFPLYWWLAVIRERGRGVAFGRLILALILVAAFLGYVGRDAISAFYGRAAGVADVKGRLAAPLTSPYRMLPEAGLIGFGIGATHQTAATLASSLIPYSWLKGNIVEAESGRVMLELGSVGFFLVYFVRLYLAVFSFRQAVTLRSRFHRTLATACFLFFLTAIPGGAVFDVISDVYYWFFAGLLVLAMKLDRAAVRAASRPVVRRAQPEPALPAAAHAPLAGWKPQPE
jgi:hypothetical protein